MNELKKAIFIFYSLYKIYKKNDKKLILILIYNFTSSFDIYFILLLLMPKSKHNKSAFPVSNKLPGGHPVPASKL